MCPALRSAILANLAVLVAALCGAGCSERDETLLPPVKLVFLVEPGNGTAATAISPAVQVAIQNVNDATVESAADAVTLAIGTNPGGGTLSGTVTVTAVNGIATFSDLSINRPGTGYTLDASAAGLAGAASQAFDIAVGTPHHLAYGTPPPTTAMAGATWTAFTVRVEDAAGNLCSGDISAVTVALSSGSGVLTGTLTRSTVSGIATFNDISHSIAESISFDVSDGTLTGITGTAVTITADPSLVGWWKFDETTGLVAADSTSPGHAGSLVNFPGDNSQWITGQVGGALDFANTRYVSVPHDASLELTGNLTIAMWVNPAFVSGLTGGDPALALFSKRSYNRPEPFALVIRNGGDLGFEAFYSVASTWIGQGTGTGALTAGAWQHVAVTRSLSGNSVQVYLYVNGVGVASGSGAWGAAAATGDPVWIGRDGYFSSATNTTYDGGMDDVRLYNRPLPPDQILSLYLAGQ